MFCLQAAPTTRSTRAFTTRVCGSTLLRGRFGNAHTEDEPARGGATQTDASATHVAFVGVASATALRVYPAFGVLKGERHTVKKGKFLFIFVWAIMMTSCFVYSDTGRTPRRRRARRAPRGGRRRRRRRRVIGIPIGASPSLMARRVRRRVFARPATHLVPPRAHAAAVHRPGAAAVRHGRRGVLRGRRGVRDRGRGRVAGQAGDRAEELPRRQGEAGERVSSLR